MKTQNKRPLLPDSGRVRQGKVFLTMFLFSLGFFSATASPAPAEVRWNELATLIVGHNVTIPMAGRVAVAGDALSVREDSLMLDIKKTSDADRYPKGQTLIPRSQVTEIRVVEGHGSGGRILGSIVGALVGTVGGAEIAVHRTHLEATGVLTFAATAVAGTVAGYYVGRSVDRHVKVLRIAPSSPVAEAR